MRAKRGQDLTHGPIGKSIVSLAVPMMLGMAAILSYSVADTWFIGQLGTLELAAVSFTFPVNFIVGAVSVGLGVGTSSVISRLVGSKDVDSVQRIATHALLLAIVAGAVVIVAGLLTIEPLFRLLGADDTTLPLIERYMRIYYLGGIFFVLPMIASNVLRANGDAATPAKIMTASALFNVVLDPIFIFGYFGVPRMEIEGAALATVIANILTATVAFGIIYFRDRLIRFCRDDLRLLLDSWQRILHVGIPSLTSSLVVPMTTAFITWQVSQFGPEAVAGFGVASRLEGLVLLAIMGFGASVPPFVGQNFGAGEYERVRQGLRFCYLFCIGYGLAVAALTFSFAGNIAGLFTDDEQAIATARMHLTLVPWSYALLGISACATSAFNAIGKPMPGMYVSLSRTVGVYAPLALLLTSLMGVQGVFLAAFTANVIAGTIGLVWFRQVFREFLEPTPAEKPA